MALSLGQKEAFKSVGMWLQGEHEYQFAKNMVTHRANAFNSRKYIIQTEIPNKWHRFQTFRNIYEVERQDRRTNRVENKLALQVGQNILKACSAARGAAVWEGVLAGKTVEESSSLTWINLKNFFHYMNTGKGELPKVPLLKKPLETAVNDYAGKEIYGMDKPVMPTFLALGALSVAAITEQTGSNKKIIIPAPGVPSGELLQWNNTSISDNDFLASLG